jgi:hypothetical protein
MKKSDLINTRLITTIAELNVAKDKQLYRIWYCHLQTQQTSRTLLNFSSCETPICELVQTAEVKLKPIVQCPFVTTTYKIFDKTVYQFIF